MVDQYLNERGQNWWANTLALVDRGPRWINIGSPDHASTKILQPRWPAIRTSRQRLKCVQTERNAMECCHHRPVAIQLFSFLFFLRLYFLAIDDRSSGHKPLVTRFLGLFLCQCWFSLWALRPLRPLATHFGSRPIRWGIHYSWRLTGLSFACSSYWVLTPSRSWLTWVLTPLLDGILHHVRGLVLKCDCIFYCEPN